MENNNFLSTIGVFFTNSLLTFLVIIDIPKGKSASEPVFFYKNNTYVFHEKMAFILSLTCEQ